MAETVFMIHGMFSGAWYWAKYRSFFEERGYHCVTATLRFHDADPRADPDPALGMTSLLDYAEDLEAEIRQLGAKPILMGHSMGGLLTQILGSRGLGKALVLLTSSAPAGILSMTPSAVRGSWSVLTKWGFWMSPIRSTFDEAVYSLLNLLPPTEQKATYDRFVYDSGRAGTEIACWYFDRKGASRVDESKVTCPVLVIGAAKDRATPVAVVRRIASKYRAVSTYQEFPNHAHWIAAEPGWQEVAEYVAGWLERTLRESA